MPTRGQHRHLRPRKQTVGPQTTEERIEWFLTAPLCASCKTEEVSRVGLLCVECNEWADACEDVGFFDNCAKTYEGE